MGRPPKEKKPISLVERRMKTGSIFAASAREIPMKEAGRWAIRIVNSAISYSHLLDMKEQKGWVFADPDDLAVKAEDVGFRILDGRIVRGTHGEEVLMKMERSDYAAVQKMKDQMNRQTTFGKKAVKASILEAAGKEPGGDEGADYLNRTTSSMTVTDSIERVHLED